MKSGPTLAALARAGAVLSFWLTAGCRLFGATPSVDLLDDPAKTIVMPKVVHTDVDKTGRRLAAAGLAVVVQREEAEYLREGQETIRLPHIVRPFRPSEWNHMIAEQEPAAGTPVPRGSTVTLTAGMHHGAGPFGAWLGTHRYSVAVRGETRCRDCHPQSYCLDCHARTP